MMDRPASAAMHVDGIYGCRRLAHKQTCLKEIESFNKDVCPSDPAIDQEERRIWFT